MIKESGANQLPLENHFYRFGNSSHHHLSRSACYFLSSLLSPPSLPRRHATLTDTSARQSNRESGQLSHDGGEKRVPSFRLNRFEPSKTNQSIFFLYRSSVAVNIVKRRERRLPSGKFGRPLGAVVSYSHKSTKYKHKSFFCSKTILFFHVFLS